MSPYRRVEVGMAAIVIEPVADPERLRRRQQLLERRQMTIGWRQRLLSRRIKHIKGHRDLARRLGGME